MRLSPSMFPCRATFLRLAEDVDAGGSSHLRGITNGAAVVAEDVPCRMGQASVEAVNRAAYEETQINTTLAFGQKPPASGRDVVIAVRVPAGREHLVLWRSERPLHMSGRLFEVGGLEVQHP